ncbi:hypothetical protein Y032_0008g106 [Ancylostoma ceylanicum]|uniref:Uncharacterized protein n=1 Tax=Ancylostoma ceylanicum TaxID=53326 RepID=A0A016VJR7_9BILA|nr:hypothetical protein Y032_0008g106 [Ancylostoma ceylanicum]
MECLQPWYSELQTAVDKGRDQGAGALVVCCTEAAGMLGRNTEESRYVVISRCVERCSRQPECPRRGPVPCLGLFGVHCTQALEKLPIFRNSPSYFYFYAVVISTSGSLDCVCHFVCNYGCGTMSAG